MNGILLVDKPQGWTSFDVAAKLKGLCHPMATGLLVLFLGRATRAVPFAENHTKRYIASLRPGVVTDTQDITGHILESRSCSVSPAELEEALASFRGEIEQIPPMYSAIQINGHRLYDIARRGGEVERRPRPVTIHELKLLGQTEEGDYLLDVLCSKEVGAFRVEQAHTMEELIAAAESGTIEKMLLGVDSLFPGMTKMTASAEQERMIRCGNAVEAEAEDGEVLVYSASGELLMLGRAEGGVLYTIKSFFEV